MTPKTDTEECPVTNCSGKKWEDALMETNRVLSTGLNDIKNLQIDHRTLQQLNLEALQEQSKHNAKIEMILAESAKQDGVNDEIFTRLRELSKEKVEIVDFRLALEDIKQQSKNGLESLRTDGKWFIGISLTAVTIVLSLVVILMNFMNK